jgi:N-acetylglutamate synthase-like GNAT family acetyltransferase
MKWCTDVELNTLLALPNGYAIERLHRSEISELVRLLAVWYPDIAIGSCSPYLDPHFYESNVALRDEVDKDLIVWVVRYSGAIVGMSSAERIVESRAVYGRLGVIAPEHRKSSVTSAIAAHPRERARLSGAEYVFVNATLKHQGAQRVFEKLGYELVGITPGADREIASDGSVKRVYEAVYSLCIAPEEEFVRPDPENLTPRTRALFEFLFGPGRAQG